MLRRSVFRLSLAALALGLAAPAAAEDEERFYVTVTGGYRLGASFEAQYAGPGGGDASRLNVPGGGMAGVTLDFRLSRNVMLEASYDRQFTALDFDDTDLTDLYVDLWQAGIHYEFLKPEDYTLDGYLIFTLGATRLIPTGTDLDLESETRFSGGLGVGTKAFFTENLGVRLQGRFLVTSVGDGDAFCAIDVNCYVPPDWVWLYQGDFTAGAVVRF